MSANNRPASPEDEENADQKSILIIEDEDGVRTVLEELLSMEGYKTTAVDNGMDGLALFRQTQFDLIFTDIRMPGMSGWEVSRAIREINPDIPIIVITGWDPESIKEEMSDVNANMVLKKPFDVNQVLDIVSKLIQ